MSASQQLRILGGPVETIARTMKLVEDSLRESIRDPGELALRLTEIRRHVGQAVLDAYSYGRSEAVPVKHTPITTRDP